jgi:Fur family ferric uptake transcriptional regulator
VPSTVYRTLDLLEELGLISHIHNADGREDYHPAAEQPHAHLICRDCGDTREISTGELSSFVNSMSRQYAFDVDVSHLAVFGHCQGCASH